jgi:N utilization substance protein A
MNRELLMLVEAISREKNVERDVVFGAVEAALAQATKKLYEARSTSAWPSTATPATTRPSAAGWWCPTRPACRCPTEILLFEAKEQIPTSRWTSTSRSRRVGAHRPHRRHGGQAGHPAEDPRRRARDAAQRLHGRGEKIFTGTVKRMDKGDIIVESGRVEGRLRAAR